MHCLDIKIYKEHPDAVIPTIAYDRTSAGFDFIATRDTIIPAKGSAKVPNGLRIVIPSGYYMRFATRSSMGFMKDLYVYSGLLDPSFMGNLDIKIYNFGNEDILIKKGDRYAQGIFGEIHRPEFQEITEEEFKELEKTARGYWGSTGK